MLTAICFVLGGCQGKEAVQTIDEVTSVEETVEADTSKTLSSDGIEATTEEQTTQVETNADETQGETLESIDGDAANNQIKRNCEPVKVKGIYVSGPIAGNSRMQELIKLVDETELNAMVIDVKNDDGRVTYKMNCDAVTEIDAGVGYIRDIDQLVKTCKEKNIYLIARIVAFKDPYLASMRPELAIQQKGGGIFKDKKGLAWVNPYKREVWQYLVDIGKQAVADGFDEIQFDYIRFCTEIKDSTVDYGEESQTVSKIDIITQFTEYAYEELSKEGAYVAADVYGTIIDSKVDQRIVGQDYVEMAKRLDYICPMLYPSHYANGVYGMKVPDAEPRRCIRSAMNAANKELAVVEEGEHLAINRVWLQSFTAGWVNGHISYGKQEIRDQIRGAYEAGYDEWILWNAAVKYQRANLLTDEESIKEKERWDKNKNEPDPSTKAPQEEVTSVPEATMEPVMVGDPTVVPENAQVVETEQPDENSFKAPDATIPEQPSTLVDM